MAILQNDIITNNIYIVSFAEYIIICLMELGKNRQTSHIYYEKENKKNNLEKW